MELVYFSMLHFVPSAPQALSTEIDITQPLPIGGAKNQKTSWQAWIRCVLGSRREEPLVEDALAMAHIVPKPI